MKPRASMPSTLSIASVREVVGDRVDRGPERVGVGRAAA